MSRIDYSKWDHIEDSSDDDDNGNNNQVRTTRLDGPSSVTFGGSGGVVQINNNTPTTTTATPTTTTTGTQPKPTEATASKKNVEKPTPPPSSSNNSNEPPPSWTDQGGQCRLNNNKSNDMHLFWCQDRYSVSLRFAITSDHESDEHQQTNNNNKWQWNCRLEGKVYSYADRNVAVSTDRAQLRIVRTQKDDSAAVVVFVDDEIPYPVHLEENADNESVAGELDWSVERHGSVPYLCVTLFKASPMAGLTLWWKRPLVSCTERVEDNTNSDGTGSKSNNTQFQQAWNQAHQQFLSQRRQEEEEDQDGEDDNGHDTSLSSAKSSSLRDLIVATLPNDGDDKNTNEPTTTSTPKTFNTKLILHLDINETILIGDEAGGDSREDCLNKVLSKAAFVQAPIPKEDSSLLLQSYQETQHMEPTHWWDGTPLQDQERKNGDDVYHPPLYTGWEWPPGCCPYYRTALKRHGKNFVQPGHHGHQHYRPLYDFVDQKLAAMEHSVDGLDEQAVDPALHRVWAHMIPATFTLLESLAQRQQEQDFTVVFRTFGTDLPDIAKAITAFAQGKHPKYPNFCNPHLHVNKLYKGRWTLISEGSSDATKTATSPIDRYKYQLLDDLTDQVVASGDEEIVRLLESTVGAVGIQDHFDFWQQNDYVPWAGKPVWVPAQPDKTTTDNACQKAVNDEQQLLCHHLFFDDNIHHQVDDSIASVRVQSRPNGPYRTLTGQETLEQQGLHLIRVPTIEPLMDDEWFVQQVDKAKEKFDQIHQ